MSGWRILGSSTGSSLFLMALSLPVSSITVRANSSTVISCGLPRLTGGEPLTVYGDGSQTRSFCYVEDLVEGIYRLLQSDTSDPVNLGSPHEMTVLEFARTVIELTGSDSAIKNKELGTARPSRGRMRGP